MTYEEFKSSVVERVKEVVRAEAVEIYSLTKNNNVEVDGLVIREKEINITPTIYLNSYYESFKNGTEFEEIVESIISCYEAGKLNENFDLSFIGDFSQARDNIIFRLVNKKMNEDLLGDVPHIEYMDLAIVFYYYIESMSGLNGQASIMIHTRQLNCWGVSIDELMEAAVLNTPRILKISIDSILNELAHMNNMEVSQEDLEGFDMGQYMYIVSNEKKLNGASAILYKDSLQSIARRLNSDFYIIPSSVHEVIAIPYNDFTKKQESFLKETIAFVNNTEVSTQDVLSNNLYFFSREDNELKIC